MNISQTRFLTPGIQFELHGGRHVLAKIQKHAARDEYYLITTEDRTFLLPGEYAIETEEVMND